MDKQAKIDLNMLKSGGILPLRGNKLFSIRLDIVGGKVTADQLRALADLCVEYGAGHVHLTTRQGVEIPCVPLQKVNELRDRLRTVGLSFGACGPRVRTITACQSALCPNGLIDAQALAQQLRDTLMAQKFALPHKFKIGITGCPNACIKPAENDLGVMGVALKTYDPTACAECGLCVNVCPVPGTLQLEESGLVYNEEKCVGCGLCTSVCPTAAWEKTGIAYAIFVGGKMGKQPKLGMRISVEPSCESEVLRLVESCLRWYERNGSKGERFRDTIDRLGLETLEAFITENL